MSTPVVLNPIMVVDDGYGRTVGVTDDERRFKVDVSISSTPDTLNLSILEGQITDVQLALDGYHPDVTGIEHYNQLSDAIQTILKDLDGYDMAGDMSALEQQVTDIQLALDGYATVAQLNGLNQTVTEHYNQHSDALQTILKELDGYDGYNMFGTDYMYAASEGRSVTTSESYQTKVTLNTGILNGTYRVAWTAVGDGDDDETHRYRLRDTTNNTTLSEFRIEPEEDNNRFPVGAFREIEFNAESRQLRIQWRSGDSGEDAAIRQARIELWRVK